MKTIHHPVPGGQGMTPETAMPVAPCVTRPEFAALLSLSIRTVDRMIAAGEVAVLRPHGRAVRIQRAEAERVLAATKAQSAAKQTFPQNKQQQTKNITP